MKEPKIEVKKSITFCDGTIENLASCLNEFLEYGNVSKPITVKISRVEHDRMPGSYDVSVTLSYEGD